MEKNWSSNSNQMYMTVLLVSWHLQVMAVTDNKEIMGELDLSGQIVSEFETQSLMQDLRHIIEQARGHVAATANYEQTMMYWHIGERINRDVLGNQRAEYGKQIVAQVARQLQEEYGKKGFDEKSIRRMMQFAIMFPEEQIVAQLARKLFWSHFIEVLPLKDSLQREFYITMAASGRWGRDKLRKEIDGMLFERTAISGKPEEFIKKELSTLRDDNVMSPDLVFKSPYFLEFTGLKGFYSEKTLEDCLVAHLEQFLIELGNGFCFEARQKRILIDGDYFKIDLIFYHRVLKCHFLVELKIDKFHHEYASQLNMYLNYFKHEVMMPDDNPPIGLLLCADYGETVVKYATGGLDPNLFVQKYHIKLPTEDEIKAFVAQSIRASK